MMNRWKTTISDDGRDGDAVFVENSSTSGRDDLDSGAAARGP